jgi:signal recognition particle GTPase
MKKGENLPLIESAELDPFLHQHFQMCQYLSKIVYEELIEIMGKRVQNEVV